MRFENFRASVHLLAKDTLMQIKLPAHVDVLRPLSGKKKSHRPWLLLAITGHQSLGRTHFQGSDCVLGILADHSPPVRKKLSAYLQRVRVVAEGVAGMDFEMFN